MLHRNVAFAVGDVLRLDIVASTVMIVFLTHRKLGLLFDSGMCIELTKETVIMMGDL